MKKALFKNQRAWKGTTFVGFKEDFLARSSGFVVDLRTASNDAFFETRFDLRRILFD